MLIVKPYGRSSSERDEQGRLRRVLRTTAESETPRELAEFAKSHPELVIAQWASVIDKIARKPRGNQRPTQEQRELREALGQAAFRILHRKGVFVERRDELKRLWWRKIHPYGKGEEKRGGHPKGHWFEAFAGSVDPADVDADAVAGKIEHHLHVWEHRREGAIRPEKRAGLIAARAESIVGNVPRPPSEAGPSVRSDDQLWSAADLERYESAGDVAAQIVQVARDLKSKAGRGHPRMSMRDAAPVLHEQFGRLFRGDDGTVPTVKGACEAEPGLFALHMAIKDAYTGILKGRRTKDVSSILPQTMDELMRLVEARRGNRELADLIRLGKVIHYESAPPGHGDQPANIVANWPNDIESSRYWTSEGQSEIKRNEALVRVWRGVVALAARTVKDWADPQGSIDPDILFARKKALNENFDAAVCRRKIGLLFGERDDVLAKASGDQPLLELALQGLEQLRNSSFHFKGRQGFAKALVAVGNCGSTEARSAAHELWCADEAGRAARLRDTMRSAHFEIFLCRAHCQAVFDAVSKPSAAHPPLPRFRRVLQRAENAWKALRLPSPGNRAALEEDRGRLCQYRALKLVYERAFPEWLADRPACDLNNWIDRAVKRATKDARRINSDPHALAKIDGLARLRDGETVDDFFDRLAAATATEFRVQRGYDPDPDRAREQSRYLENARLDVAAHAFKTYLRDTGFTWLLEKFDCPSEKSIFDVDSLSDSAASGEDPKDWMVVLYFLVHLVPVGDIVALRHQLRKWAVLESNPSEQVGDMGRVFDLYIDMHDSKFEGGRRLDGAYALRRVFENDTVFTRVCPEQPAFGAEKDAGRHVPWRGLREILRFGALEPLMPTFEKHRITASAVEELEKAEAKDENGASAIAASQKRREELHERWIKEKKRFSHSDRKAYRETLFEIANHRHRTAHVRLDNHARLHRLSMRVLGRLVDYAGLWERDLYFATLALFSHRGKQPRDVSDNKWQKLLEEGRIVDALRRLEKQSPSSDGGAVFNCLKERFGACFLRGPQGVVRVRNDLAHFNMLKKDRVLNLTEAVNDTRRLMAYDRKLKNAVSKSVVEMLRREGLNLSWRMEGHQLCNAKISPWQIKHLGDKDIRENLHGHEFVAMVAKMFDGQLLLPDGSVHSVHVKATAANPGRRNRRRSRQRHRKPGNS